MILRIIIMMLLKRQLANFPVVALLGARQVGKTILARQLEKDWDGSKRHFDLEDPADQARDYSLPAEKSDEAKIQYRESFDISHSEIYERHYSQIWGFVKVLVTYGINCHTTTIIHIGELSCP